MADQKDRPQSIVVATRVRPGENQLLEAWAVSRGVSKAAAVRTAALAAARQELRQMADEAR